MNTDRLVNDLERAANMLMSAPELITADQRREAENVFISFHKSLAPYAVCKHMMETCENYYVIYQAAATLQESLVREWITLDPLLIESLRVFLMHYIVEKTDLQPYIRETIVQTIAVIHKRYAVDNDSKTVVMDDSLFSDIAQLIHSGTHHAQLVACSILSALLNEYASGSRTSCFGLTWEQHNKCKRKFEQHEMKQVLVFCIRTLGELNKCFDGSSITNNISTLTGRILGVIEQVLTWEFTSHCHARKHVGSFNSCLSSSFKPPTSWKDVVLDEGLINTLLTTCQKVGHFSELTHQSLLCVAQLGSMNGSVFSSDNANVDYLNYFINSFLDVVTNDPIKRDQVLDIANVLFNIVSFPPWSIIEQINSDIMSSFLTFLSRITCDFCKSASNAVENDDSTIFVEAFDRLLETWMKFIAKYFDSPNDMLKNHAVKIFNVYLHCHLAPPEGSRCQVEDEKEEYDEMEEDDKDKFSYQLQTIGSFGRLIPEYSIPLLSMSVNFRLLNERINRLYEAIKALQQCNPPSKVQESYQQALDIINEDVHWLLLLAASTIGDDVEGGETLTIPSSVARSSPSTLSGAMLSQLKLCSSGDAQSSTTLEPVVSVIAAVFRLCRLQRTFFDSGVISFFSPQVGRSLSHLLMRWSYSYLFLDKSCYEKLASEIGVVFSNGDSDSINWTASFLLSHVILNLTSCSGEPDLVEETLNLLTSLVERKQRCDSLWKLAQEFSLGNFTSLSSKSRRQLCQALVLASTADFDLGCKEAYVQIVFRTIQDRLRALTSRSDLLIVYHELPVQSEVIFVVDCLCSVADSSRSDNTDLIFAFLYPMIIDCVYLIDLYHNYDEIVQSILQLFNVMAKQVTCYLSEKDCRSFYEVILSMMKAFTKHNIGRQNLSKDTEEEQFAAILTLMDLLNNLLSKDFIDFATEETRDGNTLTGGTCAADVVLYGLNIFVPLMTAELLKFPALCNAYMALLAYLAEIHADRLCRLPDDFLRQLLTSVEYGLTSSAGSDIVKACLEVLASISSHVCSDPQLIGTPAHLMGAHFLEIMFNMLLLNTFDIDLLETAGTAFYTLICIHQSHYSNLVNKLLVAQSESPHYQRLLCAFNALTSPGQKLTVERSSRTQFLQNFDRFLIEIRSVLCVR